MPLTPEQQQAAQHAYATYLEQILFQQAINPDVRLPGVTLEQFTERYITHIGGQAAPNPPQPPQQHVNADNCECTAIEPAFPLIDSCSNWGPANARCVCCNLTSKCS